MENNILKRKQEFADRRLESNARREALDMFMQLQAGHILLIPKPITCIIECYYPYESKYDSKTYKELVNYEFKKLKEQYGK